MNISNLKITGYQFALILFLSSPISIYLYSIKSNLITIDYKLTAGFRYPLHSCGAIDSGSLDKQNLLDDNALSSYRVLIDSTLKSNNNQLTVPSSKIKIDKNTFTSLYKFTATVPESSYDETIDSFGRISKGLIELEESIKTMVYEKVTLNCVNAKPEKLYGFVMGGKIISATFVKTYSSLSIFLLSLSPFLISYLYFVILNYSRKLNSELELPLEQSKA
jgi:hypothetical protein